MLVPLVALGVFLLRVETATGTLVVEVADDEVEARVKNGKLVLSGPDGKVRYTLSAAERDKKLEAGAYTVRVEGADGLTLDTPEFVLKKGETVTVRVTAERKAVAKGPSVAPERQAPSPSTQVTKPSGSDAVAFKNSIGMEFVSVPKGKSWLGGGGGKPGDREVEFKSDFYLGKYPVTQAEWAAVTGKTPSHFSRTGAGRDVVKDATDAALGRLPVEMVSWEECQEFVKLLNEQVREPGWTYRLPTGAEWEFACRGGPQTDRSETAFDYYFDKPTNQLLHSQANFDERNAGRTNAVDAYPANRLGLHDMHGNVHNWCEDAGRDADTRVIRGGSFWSPPAVCRALSGGSMKATAQQFNMGLRLARVPAAIPAADFTPLFNGKDLTGWKAQAGGRLTAWGVTAGVLHCGGEKGGWLLTEKEYANYELRLEYKLSARANSGVAIRSTPGALPGREIEAEVQLLDDEWYLANLNGLRKDQQTGALYEVVPPSHPAAKPAGEWNTLRVVVDGRVLVVELNDVKVVEADLAASAGKHPNVPGLRRATGHIGLASSESRVEFRKVEIKELPATPKAAADFTPLFNGKDLTGWTGVAGLWAVRDGLLVGSSQPNALGYNTCLCADREYGDFELRCQLKLVGGAKANSGLQVRSKLVDADKRVVEGPQVDAGGQFWGSLYGERSGGMMQAADPGVVAKAVKPGEFNDLSVRCVGTRVTIKLNGVTTVDREFPGLPARGLVGLQLHGGAAMAAEFRTVEIKDLSADAKGAGGFVPLFNGKDLTGWKQHPESTGRWAVEDGAIVGRGKDQSHLFTTGGDYTDFHIRVEAKINSTGNSGVCFRTKYFGQGRLQGNGYEANIEGDRSVRMQTGSLMHISPQGQFLKQLVKPGDWFGMEVIAIGKQITIRVNGETTVNLTDPDYTYRRGYLALQQLGNNTEVHFRKIEIKDLSADAQPPTGPTPSRRSPSGSAPPHRR